MWLKFQSTSSALELSGQTTLMIRRIQRKYTPKLLEWEISKAGSMNQFDYLHIPSGSKKGQNRGFAFVSFTTPAIADISRACLTGECLPFILPAGHWSLYQQAYKDGPITSSISRLLQHKHREWHHYFFAHLLMLDKRRQSHQNRNLICNFSSLHI